jgi:hypothetical protein
LWTAATVCRALAAVKVKAMAPTIIASATTR